ncbi:pseudouridine synthase [Pyrrhoderma noxium]|uniref:Pseudouridine synthase n=1 Tax=Pyrrhoderma noxium TaxID=2282107 RepID=A0A286UKL8_9AGAM|nr:pseudouridine synthase [Pyrrhoderma noxium]
MAVRTGTPPSLIDSLYGKQSVTIPKMPSLGLLLEHPIFESYSKRIATANEKLDPSHPDYRNPIDFDVHKAEIERFKEEHIYRRMRESEDKVEVFDRWLSLFDRYTGSDLLYFNSQGNIPPEAVQTKGQRRANPFRERKRFDATEFAADASAAAEEAKDVAEEATPAETDDVDEEEAMNKKELEEAEG